MYKKYIGGFSTFSRRARRSAIIARAKWQRELSS
jgi:hypothetical protein